MKLIALALCGIALLMTLVLGFGCAAVLCEEYTYWGQSAEGTKLYRIEHPPQSEQVFRSVVLVFGALTIGGLLTTAGLAASVAYRRAAYDITRTLPRPTASAPGRALPKAE